MTDGDTIRVVIDGINYPLRYIGIDTPEEFDPDSPVEWLSREAARANERLVGGKTVILESDVSNTDRYDRLLRYVWLRDGAGWLMVNRELVRQGFAEAKAYPPDVKWMGVLFAAQSEAQDVGIGLWGPRPEPTGPGVSPGSGQCDPAYPSVCIPPPPPDLDCADIAVRRFTVLPPDPHNFDGDHNGIGCESG